MTIAAQRSSVEYFAFGLNYEQAPVALREPFDMGAERLSLLATATAESVSAEWLVVSTCNRVECYGYGTHTDMQRLRDRLAQSAGRPWPGDVAFTLRGAEAIGHVVEVTGGLKSQVLGDVQILQQVKSAYRTAHARGTVGPHLHRLMHIALATAKRILTETRLSRGNPSVASLAARVARRTLVRTFPVTPPIRAVVLGAGEMGQRLGRMLSLDRTVQAALTSRSPVRARELGDHLQIDVVPWAERLDAVARADVAFVATAADTYVLSAGVLPPPRRRQVLIIDIGVPRNVDPAIDDLDGYRVLDIDALRAIESEEQTRQARGYVRAVELCRAASDEVLEWERQQRLLGPAIATLHDAFEHVRAHVLENNLHRFDPAHRDQVDHLTRAMIQKLIAIPLVRIKQLSANPATPLEEQVTALASLFSRPACEEDNPESS